MFRTIVSVPCFLSSVLPGFADAAAAGEGAAPDAAAIGPIEVVVAVVVILGVLYIADRAWWPLLSGAR